MEEKSYEKQKIVRYTNRSKDRNPIVFSNIQKETSVILKQKTEKQKWKNKIKSRSERRIQKEVECPINLNRDYKMVFKSHM
jgi:hypothetical protein